MLIILVGRSKRKHFGYRGISIKKMIKYLLLQDLWDYHSLLPKPKRGQPFHSVSYLDSQ